MKASRSSPYTTSSHGLELHLEIDIEPPAHLLSLGLGRASLKTQGTDGSVSDSLVVGCMPATGFSRSELCN